MFVEPHRVENQVAEYEEKVEQIKQTASAVNSRHNSVAPSSSESDSDSSSKEEIKYQKEEVEKAQPKKEKEEEGEPVNTQPQTELGIFISYTFSHFPERSEHTKLKTFKAVVLTNKNFVKASKDVERYARKGDIESLKSKREYAIEV